jgi:hypothetical protein
MACYHTCQNFRNSLLFIFSKICSLTSSLGYGSIYRDMKSVLLIAMAIRVTSACSPFHNSVLTEMSFRMLCLKRNSWELGGGGGRNGWVNCWSTPEILRLVFCHAPGTKNGMKHYKYNERKTTVKLSVWENFPTSSVISSDS